MSHHKLCPTSGSHRSPPGPHWAPVHPPVSGHSLCTVCVDTEEDKLFFPLFMMVQAATAMFLSTCSDSVRTIIMVILYLQMKSQMP